MKRTIPQLDRLPRPLYCRNELLAAGSWTEVHAHSWGQLSYAASGILGVRTAFGDFLAPAQYAVWIPASVAHQVLNRQSVQMRSLYVAAPVAATLPATTTVLEVTPLVRELILRVSALPVLYDEDGTVGRLVAVLFDELAQLPSAQFVVPMPNDRRLLTIYAQLLEQPDDARTLAQWATIAGASERTLARLFISDTGLRFGHWRQRLRLVMSLDALAAGESVATVATRHGYLSASAFIAAFRSAFGGTPGEIRSASAARVPPLSRNPG